MLERTLEVVGAVWPAGLLGTLLLIVGVGGGWTLAALETRSPVRVIAWWVRVIVLPLVRSHSWWRRAATIFANNLSMLAVLLAMSRWHFLGLLGVAGFGVSLGIGLRVLARQPVAWREPPPDDKARRWMHLGMVLNLLEPLAIFLTVGLAVARATIPVATGAAWEVFLVWVTPASLIAAGGEALWMGAGHMTASDQGPI